MSKLTNISFIFIMMFTFSYTLNLQSQLLLKSDGAHMKNIDYLFAGYDVFYGNPYPVSGKVDPGFRDQIFEVNYEKKTVSGDRRYNVPDGCTFKQTSSCDMNMAHTEITGEKSYKNTLGIEAGVEGSVKGIEFSASIEFKNISEDTSKKKTVWIESKADCKVYEGTLSVFAPPKFSENFFEGLSSLNNLDYKTNKNQFLHVISVFGTHYVKKVSMGARFGARTKITVENLASLRTNSVVMKRSLGIEKLAKITNKIENTNEQSSKTDTMFEETTIFSIGSTIPSDLKPQTWISKSIEEPMPIQYKLIPLYDLLNPQTFKLNSEQIKGLNLKKLSTELNSAINSYCADFLLPKGEVRSCTVLNSDINIPVSRNEKLIPSNKSYSIQNVETRMCINIPGGDDQPYTLTECDLKKGSKFYFSPAHGRMYIIGILKPWIYDVIFDNIHGNTDENYVMKRYRNHNHINGSQDVIESSELTYTFKNISGKCLQPKDGNTMIGTVIVQNHCNSSSLQKWRLIN